MDSGASLALVGWVRTGTISKQGAKHNMRIQRFFTLGLAAVIGLVSSQALAELCWIGIGISGNTVTNRSAPGVGSNVTLPINCRASGFVSTAGTITVSRIATDEVTIQANKTTGATENMSNSAVAVDVLSGSSIVCSVFDRVAADGNAVVNNCDNLPFNLTFRVSASCPD